MHILFNRIAALTLIAWSATACASETDARPTSTVVPSVTTRPATATAPPASSATARLAATPRPTATTLPAATATSAPQRATGIVIRKLASTGAINTQRTEITIRLDGVDRSGETVKGDLELVVQEDRPARKRQVEAAGDLVAGLLPAQARALNPSGLGIYGIGNDTYIRVDALLSICAKPTEPSAGLPTVEGFTLDGFLNLFGGAADEGLPGALIGEESVAGAPALHYALDIPALKAAALRSGRLLPELSRAEVWVSKSGGHAVRLLASGTGKDLNLGGILFSGKFDIDANLISVNQNVTIALPRACENPIAF